MTRELTRSSCLQWPSITTFAEKKEQFRGESCRSQCTGHRLESVTFGSRGIGVEAHRYSLDQGRSVRSVQRVEPGVTLSDLPTGQPHPNRAVQPAGPFGKRGEEWLTQEEAFSAGSHCPKPQFASLIPAVQHYPPAEYRPLVPIPFEHSNELFAQCVDNKRRWHSSD